MQAARAGRLHHRRHAEALQAGAHELRGLDHRGVGRLGHRVEVEVQVVGAVDVVAARVPLVQVDAAEVDDPEQRRQILHDRKVDDIAGPVLDRAELDPLRAGRGRALHEEELPRRAVRIPLHHHGAIGQVRDQPVRNVRVVLEEVALRVALLRPEDLVEVGEPDLAAAGADDDILVVAGNTETSCRFRASRLPRRGSTRRMVAPCRRPAAHGRGSNVPRGSGGSLGGRGPCRTAPATAT